MRTASPSCARCTYLARSMCADDERVRVRRRRAEKRGKLGVNSRARHLCRRVLLVLVCRHMPALEGSDQVVGHGHGLLPAVHVPQENATGDNHPAKENPPVHARCLPEIQHIVPNGEAQRQRSAAIRHRRPRSTVLALQRAHSCITRGRLCGGACTLRAAGADARSGRQGAPSRERAANKPTGIFACRVVSSARDARKPTMRAWRNDGTDLLLQLLDGT